jgi:hypothetical protein
LFDLEKEVTTWSRDVHADRCRNADEVAELADHLLCEIEQLKASRSKSDRGPLSDEQAFKIAVANLGGRRGLTAEHAKNRSRVGALWAKVVRYERAQSAGLTREHGRLLAAHAILWAVLIATSALALSKAGAKDAASWLFTVWIPLWFASEMVLRRALRSRTGA